jgi:hypothetical protein
MAKFGDSGIMVQVSEPKRFKEHALWSERQNNLVDDTFLRPHGHSVRTDTHAMYSIICGRDG